MLDQTVAVAVRVLTQLRRDRRFLALSLLVPATIMYMFKIFFDSAETPVFNPQEFVTPAGAFVVHFITYILCAIVLVRERTAQTLTRMFVNGYERPSIIGGYLLAYSLLATAQSLLVLLELRLFFDLGYSVGTFVVIYGVIWLLAIISIALGILVSNFARNEGQVFPFIPLVILPSVLFSGVIISTERLPSWTIIFSLATPLYYANEVIQSHLSEGERALIVGLIVYGVAVLLLATLTLRERD